MSKFDEDALNLHRNNSGKLGVSLKVSINNKEDLSLAYTPGVAAVSKTVAENKDKMYEFTPKGNMVAVVSDGSAVLGLGNIGAEGAYPVMEGKCALFKRFADVDAFPIVVHTQEVDEIVDLIVNISAGFGGINLEDIAAPRCFEIEKKLKAQLNIPVFHDDQHGTAIVVLAGLINAIKATDKNKDAKIVINGSGAAGLAIAKLLLSYGFTNLNVVDSAGVIYKGRKERMNSAKEEIATLTNTKRKSGSLADILIGADIFLGVSKAGLLTQEMIHNMAEKPIIFAMANPDPEITEDEAIKAGAAVVATGRSDSLNQLNNVLVFPGIFRGILDSKASQFTHEMYIAAAEALADLVESPDPKHIIPSIFDERVLDAISQSIVQQAS